MRNGKRGGPNIITEKKVPEGRPKLRRYMASWMLKEARVSRKE